MGYDDYLYGVFTSLKMVRGLHSLYLRLRIWAGLPDFCLLVDLAEEEVLVEVVYLS